MILVLNTILFIILMLPPIMVTSMIIDLVKDRKRMNRSTAWFELSTELINHAYEINNDSIRIKFLDWHRETFIIGYTSINEVSERAKNLQNIQKKFMDRFAKYIPTLSAKYISENRQKKLDFFLNEI